jgi:hypothetical protein
LLSLAEPPSPGTIAAFGLAIFKPFRRNEYMDEIKELKDELGLIAQVQAAKDRMGLLGQQVTLSVLFGITSFIAQMVYEAYGIDLIGDKGDDDDQSFSPIVGQLESQSGTTFSILQNISQQLSDLTALLNGTVTGN